MVANIHKIYTSRSHSSVTMCRNKWQPWAFFCATVSLNMQSSIYDHSSRSLTRLTTTLNQEESQRTTTYMGVRDHYKSTESSYIINRMNAHLYYYSITKQSNQARKSFYYKPAVVQALHWPWPMSACICIDVTSIDQCRPNPNLQWLPWITNKESRETLYTCIHWLFNG